MATIRRRGKRFQAIVRRGQHSQSKTFSSKSDAEHWSKKLELEIERSEAMLPNSADGVYFNELIDSYAKRCRQSKRGVGRTKSYNLRRLHNYFEHFPAQLTKHQLLEFANIRLASGVKPPTLLMDFNLIRAIAKHAIDYLDLGLDLRPFSAVQATLLADGHIGRPNERDRRPTDEELGSLFSDFSTNQRNNIPMTAIAQLSLATSMRLSEICKLEWRDFDEGSKEIIIRQRKSPTRPTDHKIPLIKNDSYDSLSIILNQRQRTGNQARVFPFNAKSISTNFARTCKKLGIMGLKFHDLRHHAISRMFENGLQIQHVRLMSGHSDLKQLSRYTNTTPADVMKHLAKQKNSI